MKNYEETLLWLKLDNFCNENDAKFCNKNWNTIWKQYAASRSSMT